LFSLIGRRSLIAARTPCFELLSEEIKHSNL
jgi:hypothetical protein